MSGTPSASPLQRAIDRVGITRLARELGLTHQAFYKWEAKRRLPRTEWTGETKYSERIQLLCNGEVTKDQLLAPWPQPAPEGARS